MTLVASITEDVEIAHFAPPQASISRGPHGGARQAALPHDRVAMEMPPVCSEYAGDIEAAAEKIGSALRSRIGEDRYDLWFDRKTQMALAGNTLLVDAGNAFSAKWIREKFREDLRSAAAAVLGRPVEICVRVVQGAAAALADHPRIATDQGAVTSARAHAPAKNASSPIALKYTLEEFVIGPSNQMAYHAVARVAEQPGQLFNPLFIHGHCGLGKTHLLQGLCQRFAKLHPTKKWLYLTGEQFTNEFLEAIKTHKTDAFRRRIRNADLLVIDDVHFLAHKKATQEEFLHTFNQVDASGKQVVLASDCGPKQIQSLSEQLSSRFVSGMVLRVDSPDLPTRLEILRRRVFRNGWNVADSVLMHIAQTSTSSVRELEGLLLQVVAGINLINTGAVGGAEPGAVLASIRERTAMRAPVPVGRIVAAAAEHFAVDPAAILQSGREKKISMARSIAMYLARQHTGMSFPEIGRAFGNKNHSTVIAACQRVEALLTSGKLLAWNTPAGPRHQAASDALHELEAAIRRAHEMKSQRKELWFNIPSRKGFINITAEVQRVIDEAGVREGLVLVNAMHITASVFINDDEGGLLGDWERWLEKLAPEMPHSQYRHNDSGEDNADAHMKRTIMGREVVCAITAGKLDFGPWEQIFYGEFDGRRRKRVLVKVIGE